MEHIAYLPARIGARGGLDISRVPETGNQVGRALVNVAIGDLDRWPFNFIKHARPVFFCPVAGYKIRAIRARPLSPFVLILNNLLAIPKAKQSSRTETVGAAPSTLA